MGSYPCDVDDILAPNLFESHYGPAWVKMCAGLNKFVSIHTLIDHMIIEAERLMKGPLHDHDIFCIS